MMRAFQLETFSGPDALRLRTMAEPSTRGDTLLIEARTIGVNFPDLLTTRGQLPDLPVLPAIPGREVSGVVMSAPADSGWVVGDEVCGYVDGGAYAEMVSVPLDRVIPLPSGADFAIGAALVINYQTAHFALVDRGKVIRGETVLVLGAAGGIGTAAVQVAGALGARVIAGVANEAQRATAIAAGAEDAVVLSEDFSRPVRSLAHTGVNVVLDPLGGTLTHEGLRCLAPEGRLLVLGFAAGSVPTISTNRLLMGNTALIGVAWGGPTQAQAPTIAQRGRRVSQLFEAGLLKPYITSRFAFDQLPRALHNLEQGAIHGKAIVEIS